VMGGAGDVGSRAVEDLASVEDVTRLTIADRNVSAAERLARRLTTAAEVRVCPVDAFDHRAVVAAMEGHDVAASALGPFHTFETRLARAAIEAGVDYASVCDEWDATEQVIDALDEEARRRGRTIVTGLGTSPGFTNLGVRFLSRDLERVTRVEISVYQPLDAGGGEAVMRHMLHIMTGQVACWRGGRRVTVPACSQTRTVEFPSFGKVQVWNMGHAEPVTLPRFLPGLEEVSFFMGYGRGAQLLVQPARLGLFRSRALLAGAVRLLLMLDRLFPSERPADGAVRLDVWGVRDGQPAHRMACGIGQMREATGLSLSIGTLMLGRRQLVSGGGGGGGGGVFAPEGCLDPLPFVRAMKEKGIAAYEDLAMTRPLQVDP
jgi:lysine 6-dehydrogenase